VQQSLNVTTWSLVRSIGADRSWFERHEGPTLLVASAIYGGWVLLLHFHHAIPGWLLAMGGGYVIQWHSSLQHEAIHGMRSLPQWLRMTLVYPPLGGCLPFELYRRSHLQHHRNGHLTSPGEDTESFYHDEKDWKCYGRVWRTVLILNQTFLGRLLIGPLLHVPPLYWEEACKIVSGDATNLGIWLRHLLACALLLLIVTVVPVHPAKTAKYPAQ
jgi:fatty acid desaturase